MAVAKTEVHASAGAAPPAPQLTTNASPYLQLQRTVGNQAVLNMFCAGRIQAKLRISQPGDPFEQEADRVADQVMRMPLDETLSPAPPQIHRKCSACASGGAPCSKCAGEEEDLHIDRKANGAGTDSESSVADNFLSGLGPGQPLDSSTRAFFEPRFRRDFSAVRIHADSRAAESARAIDARAFTLNSKIVFGQGHYKPSSSQGLMLLSHELVHVLQNDSTHGQHTDGQICRAPDGPAPMSPAHAGGAMGEADTAFMIGKSGMEVVTGPAGPSGHGLTQCGFDCVAFRPSTEEVWIIDNKASGAARKIGDASAITENLAQNLERSIGEIKGIPDFPKKAIVLQKLEDSLTAVKAGKQLPSGVRLVVTNAGGYATGVGKKLAAKGVEFVDVVGPEIIAARKANIRAAKVQGTPTGRSVKVPPEPPKVRTQAPKVPAVPAGNAKPLKSTATLAEEAAEEARIAARAAAKSMSTDAKLIKTFKYISAGIQILGVVAEVLTALDMIDMAQNKLSGGAFKFGKAISQAQALAAQAKELKEKYQEINDAVSNVQGYAWRAKDDPSAAAEAAGKVWDLYFQLSDLEQQTKGRVASVDKNLRIATAKQKEAETILNSPSASGGIAGLTFGTAVLADIFASYSDLEQVTGALNTASTTFHDVLSEMSDDSSYLFAWYNALIDVCKRGGTCFSVRIPFLSP